MANFAMRSSNATLTFKANGKNHTAKVRISSAAYTYGVNSTESHARTLRAFYPHRRALGQFTVTVDAIGYREYRNFMNWLRLYTEALLTGQVGNQKGATTMTVQIPARNINKVGILTTGINDHDNTGSMVFSPTLTFMMLKDFNDPGTAIVSTAAASHFSAPKVDPEATLAFFPVTVGSYKDTDSAIYDLTDTSVNPGAGATRPSGGIGHAI